MFEECEDKVGRLFDLCTGTGQDGRPDPSRDVVNFWRCKWGFPPIGGQSGVAQTPNSVILPGVGERLKEILNEFGVQDFKGCSCTSLRKLMNSLGPAGFRKRLLELASQLTTSARGISKTAKVSVAWNALMSGVFINPLSPYQDLILRAVAAEEERLAKPEKALEFPAPQPRVIRRAKASNPFTENPDVTPPFISTSKYMEDVKLLSRMLPEDTCRIIGVSRSGLCAASMVAMLLHLPMSIVRQSMGDLIDGGNGWRLTGNVPDTGTVVVIDDTCMTGNSFRHVIPIVKSKYSNVKSCAVYVNPLAKKKPDIWVQDLPWPHFLEWNLFNSVLSSSCGTDFDGILCRDCTREEDDDGLRYINFIRTAELMYPMRRVQIPLIVTARIEKYRKETEEWLARKRISVKKLVMAPQNTLRDRQRMNIAEFKARHFVQFTASSRVLKPAFFIESDPQQAQEISKMSNGLVVCPAAGRCFRNGK